MTAQQPSRALFSLVHPKRLAHSTDGGGEGKGAGRQIGHPRLVAALYPFGYTRLVLEIRQTTEFARWFEKLRDPQARGRILARIRRLQLGNPGDVASVGEGVSELRIPFGPGYRVYFVQRGAALVVLLAGGDKKTQSRDVARAKDLARRL